MIRYIRPIVVGTHFGSEEGRNQKIIREAEPLPEGNRLCGRASYWFVTIEDAQFKWENENKSFRWLESARMVDNNGVTHYLNRIEFKKTSGVLTFLFPSGATESITSYPKPKETNPNKRMKLSHSTPENLNGHFQAMQLSEDLWENSSDHDSPPHIDAYQPVQADTGYNNNNNIMPSPRQINDTMSVPGGEALIVNILLLVPDTDATVVVSSCVPPRIECIHKALTQNCFHLAVTSYNQQHLYSRVDTTDKHFHILVLPYGKTDRYRRVTEYLQYSSEAIILLENELETTNDLMAVKCVRNIANNPNNNWEFVVKTTSFKQKNLAITTPNHIAKPLFGIQELREVSKGGAICKDLSVVDKALSQYMLEWTLSPVPRHVVQNIYLCFKFEPKPLFALNDYAAATLVALGLGNNYGDIYVAHGSVLVYIRCPAYIPWYILVRKYKIFYALEDRGLTEIHECCISDIDASIQRPGNEQFVDELTFLKEQMIGDNVPEQPTFSRFTVKKSNLVLKDPEDLKATCETLEQVVIDNKATINQLQQENSGLRQQLNDRTLEGNMLRQEILKSYSEITNWQTEDREWKNKLQKFVMGQEKNEQKSEGSDFTIPYEELILGERIKIGRYAQKAVLNGEAVATKALFSGVSAAEATKELQLLMRLRHKNLVIVRGFTKDEHKEVLVMEYMKQGSLEDLLFMEKKKLNQQAAVKLAIDIAKGLRYLHRQKSIHGNFNTSNVLLHQKKSRAKIGDYGLAKLKLKLQSHDPPYRESYMAPEIRVGGAPTTAADIYALGAILFAMITSQHLIAKTQDQERVKHINSLITDPQMKQLIIDCVMTDLTKRPTIDMCLAMLQKMKKK